MRIIIIGTVLFSLRVLEKLTQLRANVVGVCTKENSDFNSDFADLTPLCKAYDIPYILIKNINSEESVSWIKNLYPDVILCVGLSQLIKKELLSIPLKEFIGYHPALLPHNRGRHPIVWALALGLEETGSTFFLMDEGADSGDILSQEKVIIDYFDDAQTLYDKVDVCALAQLESFLPMLEDGSYKHIIRKQDESKANTWRKRGMTDGLIDFRMSSIAIYNLVRALTRPYIGAHIFYDGKNIKVWKVATVTVLKNISNFEPGKVLLVSDTDLIVKTYDGAINIVEHEFDVLPKEGEYL